MNRVVTGEPADIAREIGANVEQLVKDGDELLVEGLIQEAWEIEGENVFDLGPVDEDLLNLVTISTPDFREFASAKSKRDQSRLQPPRAFIAAADESDEYLLGVDMREFGDALADVVAKDAHPMGEMKGTFDGGDGGASEDPTLGGGENGHDASRGGIAERFVRPPQDRLDTRMFEGHATPHRSLPGRLPLERKSSGVSYGMKLPSVPASTNKRAISLPTVDGVP
jgi:hypothetical protein